MSAIFDDIVDKIKYLSIQERDLLIEKLNTAHPTPALATVDVEDKQEDQLRYIEELREKYFLPRPRTKEEYEQKLRETFTPEQLERLDKTDFLKLPPFKKSTSQMIIEDREDRL